MRLLLIGQEQTKRTDFMRKAAEALRLELDVLPWELLWKNCDIREPDGTVVKIDPPSFDAVSLAEQAQYLNRYKECLSGLAGAGCQFLNTPSAIIQTLDKRRTKQHLQTAGLSVTEMFDERPATGEQLLELMNTNHCFSLFVKPRFFSGAAGVCALRMHPVLKKLVLYTSCHIQNNNLINTKKLVRMENAKEVLSLLDRILSLDCIIERWHPKSEYQKKSFDLRVVYQFGHIAHIVVRQSDGPITNPHLNNQALDFSALQLPTSVIDEILSLCQSTMQCFPGLSMAGLDIMLDKGSLHPRIIELNGQGDLIYQDIFNENTIYTEQLRILSTNGGIYEHGTSI